MSESQIALVVSGISFIATLLAALYARWQANNAAESNQLTRQFARSNAIMHFTDRFFDLLKEVKDGDLSHKLLSDPDWRYQFWSLQATEFYFFHRGLLPTFMYSLWMTDLANLYAGANGEQIRQSHQQYLENYSLHYVKMSTFFDEIFRLAASNSHERSRNHALVDFIRQWIKDHKDESFD